jgi:hypothetical protein
VRTSGSKRDGIAGGWSQLHNEELRDLRLPPSIFRTDKSWRKRLAGYVTRRDGAVLIRFFWQRYKPVMGYCEHGINPRIS